LNLSWEKGVSPYKPKGRYPLA